MKFTPPKSPAWPGKVAIVSLSGAVQEERLQAGIARLQALGCTVDAGEHVTRQWRYFAGTDEQRIAALYEVLAGDADVVFFSRGGFGASRLLHRIDWSRIAASGKVFCGFSDITAFSMAALAQAHYVTFAGPLAASEFAQTDDLAARNFTETQFTGLLAAAKTAYVYPECVSDIAHHAGTINGTLWGTNLALVTHLIGTPYLPNIEDGILVLEDIGEEPYAVERMFWQLKHAGILDRQRAIILGQFTDCKPGANSRYGYSMTEAIETLREIAPCPVLTGFPFGHVPAKVTLPLGAPAKLSVDGPRYTLSARDFVANTGK
ncbi:MAG: LD-carboxypeptidase [Rhizobacter sp.]|nr:LD-carboxypeptidase [Burkholderiales bacterium]